jgi:hypothetical protein
VLVCVANSVCEPQPREGMEIMEGNETRDEAILVFLKFNGKNRINLRRAYREPNVEAFRR